MTIPDTKANDVSGIFVFGTFFNLTPREHQSTDPPRWGNLLQDKIARNLEKDIRDKKYEQRDVIVMPFHVQISLEPLQSSIADVYPVEKREKEEEGQDWNDMDIELP